MTNRALSAAQNVEVTSQLIETHVDRVFAYALRLAGQHELAEDLTQQTFLLAQQHLHQLRDPDCVGRWLLRIVRNTFLKDCRKRLPVAASQMDLRIDEIHQAEVSSGCGDEEQVQLALSQLPEPFRTVVLMFYFEELSYREIAKELRLPMGTVMSRLSRAKRLLRESLTVLEAAR